MGVVFLGPRGPQTKKQKYETKGKVSRFFKGDSDPYGRIYLQSICIILHSVSEFIVQLFFQLSRGFVPGPHLSNCWLRTPQRSRPRKRPRPRQLLTESKQRNLLKLTRRTSSQWCQTMVDINFRILWKSITWSSLAVNYPRNIIPILPMIFGNPPLILCPVYCSLHDILW